MAPLNAEQTAKVDLIALGIILVVVFFILDFFNRYLGNNGFW